MAKIIGRQEYIAELEGIYNNQRAEFVAVYGRRRVGKTFLIRELFSKRFTFYHTALSPLDDDGEKVSLKEQLDNFYFTMVKAGLKSPKSPKTWLEAFFMLENLLEQKDDGSRQVVFIDELPWMDSPKSGFLRAFEAFWNGWGAGRDNLMLIVCGSATSWMLSNIINNYGGLYNRVTREIQLMPFTLSETKEYLTANSIKLSDYDIAEAYMILGGVPYYLSYFQRGLSLAQNIDQILFANTSRLKNELERLFKSIFARADGYERIVRTLSNKHIGLSRTEIAKALGKESGGQLSEMLSSLEKCGFIQRYCPLGNRKDNCLYRLSDPFCRFFIMFVENNAGKDPKFWQNSRNNGNVAAWRGIAFEELCANHIPQIKAALQIGGVLSESSSLAIKGDGNLRGSQIDLIIKRNDHVVNLCEMKFTLTKFEISSDYEEILQERIERVRQLLNDNNLSIHLTFVTSKGIKQNIHSGIVQKEVTIADLMRR